MRSIEHWIENIKMIQIQMHCGIECQRNGFSMEKRVVKPKSNTEPKKVPRQGKKHKQVCAWIPWTSEKSTWTNPPTLLVSKTQAKTKCKPTKDWSRLLGKRFAISISIEWAFHMEMHILNSLERKIFGIWSFISVFEPLMPMSTRNALLIQWHGMAWQCWCSGMIFF